MSERTPLQIRLALQAKSAILLASDTVLLDRACKEIADLERQRDALRRKLDEIREWLIRLSMPNTDVGVAVLKRDAFHTAQDINAAIEQAQGGRA